MRRCPHNTLQRVTAYHCLGSRAGVLKLDTLMLNLGGSTFAERLLFLPWAGRKSVWFPTEFRMACDQASGATRASLFLNHLASLRVQLTKRKIIIIKINVAGGVGSDAASGQLDVNTREVSACASKGRSVFERLAGLALLNVNRRKQNHTITCYQTHQEFGRQAVSQHLRARNANPSCGRWPVLWIRCYGSFDPK